MGGSSTSSQHQVQSNQINPAQMQQYQDNYTNAQGVAKGLTPYTGQITAGFNPNQVQAQGVLSGIASDPRYNAVNQSAIDATQGLLSANPNTSVNAKPYDPSQLSGVDLSKYINPYTDNVVNTTLGDLSHARDQQQVTDNASATAAGAFGGTRQSVLNANTTNDYLRNVASTSAGLRSAAYGNAQQAAIGDVGAQNVAKQFNSSQNVDAQKSSISNALAQAGYKLNAAGQLVALNQGALQTATQQGGILSAVGDAQQAQQQKALTDAWNLYTQGQQLTVEQEQLVQQALGLIPIEQTNTTDGTTTTKSNPGAMGILSGVAGLGLAAATGGSSLGLTGALGGLGGLFGGTLAGSSNGVMANLGTGIGAAGSPFNIGSIGGTTPSVKYGGIFG